MNIFFTYLFLFVFSILLIGKSNADPEKIVNIYNWSDYLPEEILQQFEKETGIHVNYSTYDSNETLYAKLKANPDIGYDIVVPSTYFNDRMHRENMLLPLDKKQIPNFKNLSRHFLNQSFDPDNKYSIPYLISATGIIYNDQYYPPGSIKSWSDLTAKKFENQLLILDDVREVFSIGLLLVGYSPNTTVPKEIDAAFLKLKSFMENVKLFNDEALKAIYIDEDASVGMIWNGDAFLSIQENPHLHFIYPTEGFILSEDSLAIPINAPHVKNAYTFINFVLRPDIAAKIAQATGYTSPNEAAKKFLPRQFRESQIMYPDIQTLKRGIFLRDVGDSVKLYENYFEQLKLS